MKISRTEIITVAALMLSVLAAGVSGYMIIEGWNLADSLYMTVITLATIGYGETHPLSPHGRIFTMLLIFGGLGIMAYAFSMFTALIVGGHLTDAFRRRKMDKQIKSLAGHYIVCGASRAGLSIAEELAKTGRSFVMVEMDAASAARLVERGWLTVRGDATEDKTLKEAGMERAAGLFCCLNNDKDNAFAALTGRLLNQASRIISAQRSEEVRQKLMRSGADAVINPGHIGGLRMVSEMVRPATVTFLDNMLREARNAYRFEDVEIRTPVLLGDIKGAQGGAALAVAVRRRGAVDYEMNPAPDMRLAEGDVVIALGSREQIASLRRGLGLH
ncbi:MAG: potassium channel protein [Elusimicrobiales bacterium]